MKIIKRFLIIIAIVILANYIVNIQTDEQNYAYKNPEICSAQNLHQYSILKHSEKKFCEQTVLLKWRRLH